jgi:hypothetical protein
MNGRLENDAVRRDRAILPLSNNSALGLWQVVILFHQEQTPLQVAFHLISLQGCPFIPFIQAKTPVTPTKQTDRTISYLDQDGLPLLSRRCSDTDARICNTAYGTLRLRVQSGPASMID